MRLVMDAHRIRVGENIRARRKELGWSVPFTARKLPVSDKTLERWERGEAFGHMKNLERLADVLETTVAELMRDPDAEVAPTETPDLMGQAAGFSKAQLDRIEGKLDKLLRRRAAPTVAQILAELEKDETEALARYRRRRQKPSDPPTGETEPGSQR